jgi:hypothetical protein
MSMRLAQFADPLQRVVVTAGRRLASCVQIGLQWQTLHVWRIGRHAAGHTLCVKPLQARQDIGQSVPSNVRRKDVGRIDRVIPP